ncbi:MAG: hypothetical protein JWQ64_2115 [Subtercola sp.]|jgi:NitT/TauT family transport system substrate-binding protein|nr:hypothetical protein [Subtercola sp.]
MPVSPPTVRRSAKRFRAGGLALALAATVGLVLSGCAAGATSTNSSGVPLQKVSVAYSSPGASYSDLYVGISEGVFKNNGLDVDLRTLNSSSQIIPALLSGSVDIAVGSATDSAAAIMKGSDLMFVAITRPVFNLEVYTSSDINSAADLKGKKIGLTTPGSQSDQALTAYLAENHMTRDDVQPVYVNSIPGQLAALQSNAVSAILSQPPQAAAALTKGYKALTQLSNIPFPSAGVVVTKDYLTAHPDLVEAFVKSEVQSLQLLQTDQAATIAAIEQYSGDTDPTQAAYAYNFFKNVWSTDPVVDPALINQAFQITAATTGTPAPTDITQYIDNSFVSKYATAAPTGSPTTTPTP